MSPHLAEEEQRRLTEDIRGAVGEAVRARAQSLPPENAPLLALLAGHAAAIEAAKILNEAVMAARHAGYTWKEIGASLGVSKQAAQHRYTPTSDTRDLTSTQRELRPVNAFNEMAVLAQAGREGWHSIGFRAGTSASASGTSGGGGNDSSGLRHILQKSEQQWEHRRDPFPLPDNRGRMERAGWQHISTIYPWQYFKRPLDEAPQLRDWGPTDQQFGQL